MSIMANMASAGRARDTVLTEQVLEKEHRNKAQTKEAIDVTRSHGMFPMAGPVRNR